MSKKNRHDPTKGDKPGDGLVPPGPRRVTKAQRKAEAAAAMAREREQFALRQRQAIAKAALELDHVDAAILSHLLLHPFLTQEEIGAIVGLGRQAINERINARKFQRALDTAKRPALEIFAGNQAAAARRLGDLIHSKDDRVALRAAVSHLWQFIHADETGKTDQDFVSFIQEAFEKAEKEKPADVEKPA